MSWYVVYRYHHQGWTPHHYEEFTSLWKALIYVMQTIDKHGANGTVSIEIMRKKS